VNLIHVAVKRVMASHINPALTTRGNYRLQEPLGVSPTTNALSVPTVPHNWFMDVMARIEV
jgi:hypothetical protein